MGIKQKYGYARVSTDKQDVKNQKIALINLGVDPDNIYADVNVSGTISAKKRTEFKKVYDKILKGEVEELHVFEMSRLGRNSTESIQLVLEIEQLGVPIISMSPNEAWTRDVHEPGIRNIFVSVFAWFADIERKSISERTIAGLKKAKDNGTHLGRPFSTLDRKAYEKIKIKNPQLKAAQIARLMQVPTTTLYRYIEKWGEEDRLRDNRQLVE